MAKIKIEIPTQLLTTIHLPVRINDINYGNHVGNSAFVALIHEARMQWLQQHQLSELNCGGVGMIMSSLAVEFKNEAFYTDILAINIYIGIITKVSFELVYQLTTNRNEKQIVIANAFTNMVCFNYDVKKVVAIPDVLLKVIE
jgi:YbgC/YbaW family acyl-CoA thioester hydrolase